MGQIHDKLNNLFAVIARMPGRNWGRTDDRIMFEDGVHLVTAEAGRGLREYEALTRAPNEEEGRGAHGDGDTRTFDTVAAVLHHAVELRDLLEHPTLRALLRALAERERQVVGEGFDTDHDDNHSDHQALAYAAGSYLSPVWKNTDAKDKGRPPLQWPWEEAWWKPKDKVRDAERGAALALAYLEQLDRDHERDEFKKLPQDDVKRMVLEVLTAAGYKGGETGKPFKEAMKAAQRGILRMARAR